VFGLFSDHLILNDETIVGEMKLEETKREIASRADDFVPTIAVKLDFVPTIVLHDRDLQAAELMHVDLRGVSLNRTILRDANLRLARLDRAQLDGADLQGADLSDAQLQGANLSEAQLQGADLSFAGLQGASLSGAQLQGADLSDAQLRGADLSGAQLQGVGLSYEQLQGASLSDAQLQGADLSGAQLQGARLDGANLLESEFDRTFVFRTSIGEKELRPAAIRSVRTDPFKGGGCDKNEPLGPSDLDDWIARATKFTPDADKAAIVARFARLKPDFQTPDQDARDHEKWATSADSKRKQDPDGAQSRQRLSTILGDLVCGRYGAPYVARGFVWQHIGVCEATKTPRLAVLGDQIGFVRKRMEQGRKSGEGKGLFGSLAETLATTQSCPGVAGFTETDWRWLDAIKPFEGAPP
jgi:uncharacterized protein YjbI with pentapeptide repeats